MPELPEVEIARRHALRRWQGAVVTAVNLIDPSVLRSGDVEELETRTLDGARRVGKHLIIDFSGDVVLLVHFRMTGRIVAAANPLPNHSRLALSFAVRDTLALVDVRRLGHVDVLTGSEALDSMPALAALGPDVWPQRLGHGSLRRRLRGTRRTIKSALLDQGIVAGVGNIVATEALWEAQIDPRRRCPELTDEDLDRLGSALWGVCQRVLDVEGEVEVVYVNERRGSPVQYFSTYGRQGEPCHRCGGRLQRIVQSGRGTTWWPACQT